MRVSIELFLLDNLMMNFLMLRLAYALEGVRPFPVRMWGASAFGAGYALLSMARFPALALLLPKLLFGAVMALPLAESPRTYGKALLCLYLAACMMAGLMLALSSLLGGGFRGGAFLCTVPVRVALLSLCGCALLPRAVRSLLRTVRMRPARVRLMVRLDDRTLGLTALVDTGNLLVEPISGLPVIVVRPGLLPNCEGRPVPYRTVDGTGMLQAIRPADVRVYQGYWHRVEAMIAESKQALHSADAIIGAGLLTEERWCMDAQAETVAGTDLSAADDTPRQRDSVCPLGGDAAAALWAAGGDDMDRTIDA